MGSNTKTAADEMRQRIFGGSRLQLDNLSKEELVALEPLLTSGEAEIINEACKPFVVRKLPKW
ncbi:hypothetical protein RXV86_19255 [Alisedimentitalea sp. MJ-SS2]|uniref:hypothetical protein n=1 Tax=Aliisedimentitalea sp. MJ-SS2 TaxID=3049795 RepID=UPI00290FF7C8|nr:hypothetical protein [Alisedimentitalea sp. MJ-SS2]MDU8929533.1 hypothetical protein [Alisedimentitalea sp. MJ-SS2]